MQPSVGLFNAIRPATLRAVCERADTHACNTRYHSVGSADLHLALDRGRGPVLADRLQRGQYAQPGRGDDRRVPLPYYGAAVTADTFTVAEPWRHRRVAGDFDPPHPVSRKRHRSIHLSECVLANGAQAVVAHGPRYFAHNPVDSKRRTRRYRRHRSASGRTSHPQASGSGGCKRRGSQLRPDPIDCNGNGRPTACGHSGGRPYGSRQAARDFGRWPNTDCGAGENHNAALRLVFRRPTNEPSKPLARVPLTARQLRPTCGAKPRTLFTVYAVIVASCQGSPLCSSGITRPVKFTYATNRRR